MWQTKRSLLNALTHALTFPVNLEGRQGGHLCCGGRGRACRNSFHHYPQKKRGKKNLLAVWLHTAAACGRRNNNKQWKKLKIRRYTAFLGPVYQAVQSPVYQCEYHILTVIWISVIAGEVVSEGVRSEREAGTEPGQENSRLNMLTSLIWLTMLAIT